MIKFRRMFAAIVVLVLPSVSVYAQDVVTRLNAPPDPSFVKLEPVATGLAQPIYLTSADDGSNRLFVLEQAGRIRLIKDGQLQNQPFMDLSSLVSQDITTGYSERGLLGLDFHPDFASNGQFFVHYSGRGGDTVIARYRVSPDNPDAGDPSTAEILFTLRQPYPNHNGGQIEFGPDGYFYIGLGDGGSAGDPLNAGQTPNVLLGKVLRIDVDSGTPYAVPDDNPAKTINPALAPEVWAWGLRNPWRFSFDRTTGDLYIADVGQNQREEVNFQAADSSGGENYGWRPYEASKPYSGEPAPQNMVLPVVEYDHSQGCSITGGYVYRGTAIPSLQGAYLFGDWCSGRVWAAYRDTADVWQRMEFLQTRYRISSFGEDDTGELYLVDYGGSVLKFIPSG